METAEDLHEEYSTIEMGMVKFEQSRNILPNLFVSF